MGHCLKRLQHQVLQPLLFHRCIAAEEPATGRPQKQGEASFLAGGVKRPILRLRIEPWPYHCHGAVLDNGLAIITGYLQIWKYPPYFTK